MTTPQEKKSTVYLLAPIALGGKTVIEGYVTDQSPAGLRVYDGPDRTGRSQYFPGHLVEKVVAASTSDDDDLGNYRVNKT